MAYAAVVGSIDLNSFLSLSLVQIHANRKLTPYRDDTRRGYCGREEVPDWDMKSYVLFIPSAKFAFCAIPKVASAEFANLFNTANGLASSNCYSDCRDHLAQSSSAALGVNVSDVTKANGWTFAYFIRDPLVRYLSAYGSKCLPKIDGSIGDEGLNCCGEVASGKNTTSAYVEHFERRVLSDLEAGIPLYNEHWVPQVQVMRDHCEKFNPKEVDYVGTLSGDINFKVKEMLRIGHVKHFRELGDTFFPTTGEIHKSHASTVSNNVDVFYSNRSVRQAVADMYSSDYAAFDFARDP